MSASPQNKNFPSSPRTKFDVLTDSLLNLHMRFQLHNDLYRRWMGSLQYVSATVTPPADQYRNRMLAG